MSTTQHSPGPLSSLFNLQWIGVVIDFIRSMFSRRYPLCPNYWPVNAIVPQHAKTTDDLLWVANCPYTGRHLGVFDDRADAESAVWEATEGWHSARSAQR